ncbi:MAG TPA: hypothetical protein PLP75_13545 [Burkholderiales bacterium]|nr:hypothetical protein [Burkholderiales bacterium]
MKNYEDKNFAGIFLDTCDVNFGESTFAVVSLDLDVVYASKEFINFTGLNKSNNLENINNSTVRLRIITEINILCQQNTSIKSRMILRLSGDDFAEINLNLIINPYTNNQLFVTLTVNPYLHNDLLLEIRRKTGHQFWSRKMVNNGINLDKLTEYQKAICFLLAHGFTNQEIAQTISFIKKNMKASNNARLNTLETSRTAINKQVTGIREILDSPSKEALVTYLLDNEFQKKLPKFIFGDELVLNNQQKSKYSSL